MKRLCIIPCGARQIWDNEPFAGPTKAREVYIGPFAKKCREYAERFYPGEWMILSSKYGFLFPDDMVPEMYDVSFKDPKTNPITVHQLRLQALGKGLLDNEQVIVLGGKNYVQMVHSVFKDKDILAPLRGAAGIGYMMGWMNEALKTGTPLGQGTKLRESPSPSEVVIHQDAKKEYQKGEMSLADQIRKYVFDTRIKPARDGGFSMVTVKAGVIHKEMSLSSRMPSVCGALDANKFLDYTSVILVMRTGPKHGSSVEWVFEIIR